MKQIDLLMITNNFDTSDIEVAHSKLDSVYVARPAVLKLNIQTVESRYRESYRRVVQEFVCTQKMKRGYCRVESVFRRSISG